MKRLIALLLALCLLLCGCGGAPEETSVPTTEAPTTEATTEAPTETTEAPTETTAAPVVYRNPLTGEVLDAPYTGRPVTVTINNAPACLPHYGITQADMFYEAVTESGITRFLAVFSDPSEVGTLGPVRSTRTFFNCISVSYDAALFHCGGSKCALRGEYDISGDTIDDWVHVNQSVNPDYFFRDTARYNSGYAWEHTLFTTGEDLAQAMEDKGYNIVNEEGTDYGLLFDENVSLNGENAELVTVNFKGGKETIMTYNAETGLYEAAEYGSSIYDAGNDSYLVFKNVLVLYAEHWGVYDGKDTHSYYTILGEGEGHFACNGQIIPIKWYRDGLRDTYSYTLTDGTPLTLGVGKTYVAIASDTTPCDYE